MAKRKRKTTKGNTRMKELGHVRLDFWSPQYLVDRLNEWSATSGRDRSAVIRMILDSWFSDAERSIKEYDPDAAD